MKPFYQDNHNTIYCLDFRENDLPDECIQMVCTSPPYWGLRRYSGDQDLIWGDNHCEHEWGSITAHKRGHPGDKSTLVGTQTATLSKEAVSHGDFCYLCGAWRGAYGLEPSPEFYVQHTIEILREIRRVLRKDGVVFWNIGDSYANDTKWGGQTGGKNSTSSAGGYPRERTHTGLKPKDLCLIPFRVAIAAQEPYQEFTVKELSDRAWLAGIIDADGCIGIHHYDRGAYHQFNPFVSVGCSDESMVNRCATITRCNGSRQVNRPVVDDRGINSNRPHYEWRLEGENAAKILEDIYPYLVVKERQARVAHALWRNIQETKDIHKGKGHKTPDSVVRDRLALWELIKKCNQREEVDVNLPPVPQHIEPGWWVRSIIIWNKPNPMPESVTDRPTESHEYILMLTKSARYYWDQEAVRETGITGDMRRPYTSKGAWELDGRAESQRHGGELRDSGAANGRNLRSVWSFPTQPYPEAHFAVFPEKLPELCIKAATPEVGCCVKCGAPWERVRKPTEEYSHALERLRKVKDRFARPAGDWHSQHAEDDNQVAQYETIGWQPTCKCNADKVPSIVLDPFAGAGTTLWVAKTLNRRAVGYDISMEYCQLAVERLRQQVML